jgi:hypothetical protein
MLCVCLFLLTLLLTSAQSARSEPVASVELTEWIELCASAQSSFKWTDLGYPWLRIDWGYKSVDTARLDALSEPCSAPTAQALRLLSDAVVISERELALGDGPVLSTFYRYWGCTEAQAAQLKAAARKEFAQALATRPDPKLTPERWLMWMWGLLTESTPWHC